MKILRLPEVNCWKLDVSSEQGKREIRELVERCLYNKTGGLAIVPQREATRAPAGKGGWEWDSDTLRLHRDEPNLQGRKLSNPFIHTGVPRKEKK